MIRVVIDTSVMASGFANRRGVAPSPKDDRVLATAVAASASYLVTRDVALHELGTYRGVVLLGPEAFLEILRQSR